MGKRVKTLKKTCRKTHVKTPGNHIGKLIEKFTGKLNRSSHLGIHKQTNACWRFASLVQQFAPLHPFLKKRSTNGVAWISSVSVFHVPLTCLRPLNDIDRHALLQPP